jgi:hypothetical protein
LGILSKFYVIFGILRMFTEFSKISDFFQNIMIFGIFEEFLGFLKI